MPIFNFGIINASFISREEYIISLKIKNATVLTTANYLYIPQKEFI